MVQTLDDLGLKSDPHYAANTAHSPITPDPTCPDCQRADWLRKTETFTTRRYGITSTDETLTAKAAGFWAGGALFRGKYNNPVELLRWHGRIEKQLMFAAMPAEFHQLTARCEEIRIKLYGNPQLAAAIPADERRALMTERNRADRRARQLMAEFKQSWIPRNRALVVVEGQSWLQA